MATKTPNNQNLLLTIINSQTDSIEAHKKLVRYLEVRVAELSRAIETLQKDNETKNDTIQRLEIENTELKAPPVSNPPDVDEADNM